MFQVFHIVYLYLISLFVKFVISIIRYSWRSLEYCSYLVIHVLSVATNNFFLYFAFDLNWFDFWFLTPLPAIFQLYRGDQF